ncbi:MAG TPA: ABC transporter ATP-binding protein [Thermodesulfobacteriota bacterium]
MTAAAAIEIRDLAKTFRTGLLGREVRALDGLSLEVQPGEIFGFLGPNGAGKTTTIKILLGFVRPASGAVRVLGGSPTDPAVRARLGFLPEHPYFYDYLTGLEFLDYVGRLHGLPAEVRGRRAARLLEQVDIAAAAKAPLRRYSKGMLQRLGLAQALMNDPELLVLDEPMSGLDPMGRRLVRDLILDLKREGRTIFFSSHILSDVETLSDRVAIVAHGRVAALGTVDDLVTGGADRVELAAAALSGEAVAALGRLATRHEARGGQHLFTLESREAADEAVRVLGRAGGRLLGFTAHRRSLEELFVERVGQDGTGRGR